MGRHPLAVIRAIIQNFMKILLMIKDGQAFVVSA